MSVSSFSEKNVFRTFELQLVEYFALLRNDVHFLLHLLLRDGVFERDLEVHSALVLDQDVDLVVFSLLAVQVDCIASFDYYRRIFIFKFPTDAEALFLCKPVCDWNFEHFGFLGFEVEV